MDHIKDSEILNSVVETYEGIAESWDRVRRRPGQIWNALLPYVPNGATVLDVGCGNGRLSEFLASKNIQYTGVDGSTKLIEVAKTRYTHLSSPSGIGDPEKKMMDSPAACGTPPWRWRIKSGMTAPKFLVSDMRSLPFENDAFDVVCCLATFHHLPSESVRLQALREMLRVARPGARILLTNWNLYHPTMSVRYRLWSLMWGKRDVEIPWKLPEVHKVYHRYYHSFFLRELESLVRRAGGVVEVSEYINNQGHAHVWNGLFSSVVARKPEKNV